MMSGPQIIQKYIQDNNIDMKDFHHRMDEYGTPEHELNHYDSRYLSHLESYVEDRAEYMLNNDMTLEEYNA